MTSENHFGAYQKKLLFEQAERDRRILQNQEITRTSRGDRIPRTGHRSRLPHLMAFLMDTSTVENEITNHNGAEIYIPDNSKDPTANRQLYLDFVDFMNEAGAPGAEPLITNVAHLAIATPLLPEYRVFERRSGALEQHYSGREPITALPNGEIGVTVVRAKALVSKGYRIGYSSGDMEPWRAISLVTPSEVYLCTDGLFRIILRSKNRLMIPPIGQHAVFSGQYVRPAKQVKVGELKAGTRHVGGTSSTRTHRDVSYTTSSGGYAERAMKIEPVRLKDMLESLVRKHAPAKS